jgi:Co/Zn/Cd efflux system component
MNAPLAAEHRAFRIIIYSIAGGIFVFATAQVFYAYSIGNRQLLKDGIDWIYDVLLYGLAAAVFGRGEKVEKASALLIAGIMAFAGLSTIYDLYDKIVEPRPIDPLVLGFSAVSAIIIAVLVVGALYRFRHSHNALIQATWLSSRNDVLKTVMYSALGFLARVWTERWPEYLLDLFAVYLCFQATWLICAEAWGRESGPKEVGPDAQSV